MKAKYLVSYLDNGMDLQVYHNVSEIEVYSIFEDMKRSYDDIHLMELKNDEYEVIESFYFDENDYDTLTAKGLIYEARWFEILMVWLIVLFVANIKRYNLLSFKKLPVFIFHIAFLLIFIGGAVTRYLSFEGQMPIGEGETTNEIISDK